MDRAKPATVPTDAVALTFQSVFVNEAVAVVMVNNSE